MSASLGLLLVCFVLVYVLHSTVLFVGAFVLTRLPALHDQRERLWRGALLGALVTAGAQSAGAPFSVVPGWSLVTTTVPGTAAVTNGTPRLQGAAEMSGPERLGDEAGVRSVRIFTLSEIPVAADAIGQSRTTGTVAASTPLAVESVRPSAAAHSSWSTAAGGALAAVVGLALLTTSWFCWRSRRRLRHWLAERRSLDDAEITSRAAALAARAGLAHTPRLSVCDRLQVPIVCGGGPGEICLPSRALTELDTSALECILAHEIAHLARRDPLWRIVRLWIRGCFFFQPLHALTARKLQELAEEACDEWAANSAGNRVQVASVLAQVAGWLQGEPVPKAALAMAQSRSHLGRRIERLLDEPERRVPAARRTRALLGFALLFAPLVLVPPIVAAPHASTNTASPEPRHETPHARPVHPSTTGSFVERPDSTQPAERTANLSGRDHTGAAGGSPDVAGSVQPNPLVFALEEVQNELFLLQQELNATRDEWANSELSREQQEILARIDARRLALETTAERLSRWLANRALGRSQHRNEVITDVDRSSR